MPTTPVLRPTTSPVFLAASATLAQCEEFVRNLSDRAYTAPSSVIRGGSIGKHVRHCLDHFSAAVLAFESGETIDYDHRERGVAEETDRRAAMEVMASLRHRLESLPADAASFPVLVRVMLTSDGAEAELASSLGRELSFATHHAVHHHAMMKAIAAEMGATCPDVFGKAPSTVSFESLRHA